MDHLPYSHSYSWVAIMVTVFFIGCTPKTTNKSLPLDTPEDFTYTGGAELIDSWWETFDDPKLNALVDTALNDNFNLLAVWYRFREAEAVVDRESSFLLPDLEAFAQTGISFPRPNFVGGENLRFGLSANYEIDLWGRIRSSIEAEEYRQEANLWDYKAAAISLAAEVTRTWYQLTAAGRQLQVISAQVSTNEKILKLIKARFGSGQIRGVDILRQQQLLQATREQRIQMQVQVELLEHQLAVLLGQPPQYQLAYQPDSLPIIPPVPETGLPVALVERRPDIQQSFSMLKAADRELASAISNQYPRLTIRGSLSQQANEAQDLFNQWAYNLGANLVAPLFYGGRLSAEVDRTEAVKMQRLFEYGQNILVAFREVEDAMVQEERQLAAIEVLEDQVNLAVQTSEQLRIQYFNGMTDYLDVLTAIDQAQQLRRDLIIARFTLLDYRIALYRALAGAFDTPIEARELDMDYLEEEEEG